MLNVICKQAPNSPKYKATCNIWELSQFQDALETKRITKHDKLADVLFSASVIIDPENQQKSIAITERDLTQQKIADEQIKLLNVNLQKSVEELKETNKELESFSYSVSHDLRAPLRIVNGYSQILEEDHLNELSEDARQLLKSIKANVVKMESLIDDLLTLSKSGKKEPQKTEVDMEPLVNKIVGEISEYIKHHAEIKITGLLPVHADPSLLSQVWVNLISNAIKYSGKNEKPVVEIGSVAKENEVIYYVKDNGAGFDMKYAAKLFNAFQRLHMPEDFDGSGIGLAIVHRIITRHGGKVWADGKTGEGATFFFSLPSI